MDLKIAVPSEDGVTVSHHFGMAPLYRVFQIENGKIVGEEGREKPHHTQHPVHDHAEGHGEHAGQTHTDMFAPIRDCQVLICGGMGSPAYTKAVETGLEVVLAAGDIRPTVEAFLKGELRSDLRRVHR